VDAPFIEWLIGQAGIGGLAAMSIYLLNRSYQDNLRREKENADTQRADKLEVMRLMTEITRAISRLEGSIDGLHDDNRAQQQQQQRDRKQAGSSGRSVP
jgi:TolA-binding protein